jgi:hypothetical protein
MFELFQALCKAKITTGTIEYSNLVRFGSINLLFKPTVDHQSMPI